MTQLALTLTPTGLPMAQSLGFEATSVEVDNYTSSYLSLPDVGKTIPPWTYGAVVALPPGIRTATAKLLPTVPAIPGPPVPTQQATLIWSDEHLPADPGHLLTQSTISQPQNLGDVSAGVGTSVSTVLTLPAGTQSLAVKTTQTGGGTLTGSAALTIEDADTTSVSTFYGQNPVITNGWFFVPVTQLPSNGITVVLDMTGVAGAGGQFTTTVVALPYTAAVGVTTFAGASVAIKPSSGNLIMATGDSQTFYGQKTNPAAGDAIVSTGSLAVGHYRVLLRVGYGATADSLEDNMKLVLAGVSAYTNLRVPAAANGEGVPRKFEFLKVATAAALHVEAIANHVVAGSIYWATLDVTPLSSL